MPLKLPPGGGKLRSDCRQMAVNAAQIAAIWRYLCRDVNERMMFIRYTMYQIQRERKAVTIKCADWWLVQLAANKNGLSYVSQRQLTWKSVL